MHVFVVLLKYITFLIGTDVHALKLMKSKLTEEVRSLEQIKGNRMQEVSISGTLNVTHALVADKLFKPKLGEAGNSIHSPF